MLNLPSFTEFLDVNPNIDAETRNTISVLSKSHPIIRNNSDVQYILNNPNADIAVSTLVHISQEIFEHNVRLAKKVPSASGNAAFMILAEQNLLNNAASILNSAIATRYQSSFDRLSKIIRNKS